MTLEQLRIFVAVAEREHMTRAAEALNVTQSAASAAIAALEARHEIPLFHRVGRGIELTEAGRMFVHEARAVLDRAASAERVLSEFGGLKRGTLRLVASQTIASYWLPVRLARFNRRYPQIAVELSIDNTDGAARRVLEGGAELGFVEGPVDVPELANWKIGADAFQEGYHGPVTHPQLQFYLEDSEDMPMDLYDLHNRGLYKIGAPCHRLPPEHHVKAHPTLKAMATAGHASIFKSKSTMMP